MNKFITLRQLLTLIGFWQTAAFVVKRLFGARTMSVTVPGIPHDLTVRFNNSDIVLLLGVFLHGDCRVPLLPAPATVLDLGANTGLTANAFAVQFPQARIIAVEPDPDTHHVCVINTRSHPAIHCFQGLVGASAGWGRILNPEAISMAKRFAPTESFTNADIPISTIARILDKHDCQEPVLVKLDVEGAEREIFSAGADWLPRVQGVLVEPHGEGTAELIREALIAHGFTIGEIGEKILGLRNPWGLSPSIQSTNKP